MYAKNILIVFSGMLNTCVVHISIILFSMSIFFSLSNNFSIIILIVTYAISLILKNTFVPEAWMGPWSYFNTSLSYLFLDRAFFIECKHDVGKPTKAGKRACMEFFKARIKVNM